MATSEERLCTVPTTKADRAEMSNGNVEKVGKRIGPPAVLPVWCAGASGDKGILQPRDDRRLLTGELRRDIEPGDSTEANQQGVGDGGGQRRWRPELHGTAGVLVELDADAHEVDRVQLVEDEVGQEAEHDAAGQEKAGDERGAVVHQVDGQASDEHGWHGVEHPA